MEDGTTTQSSQWIVKHIHRKIMSNIQQLEPRQKVIKTSEGYLAIQGEECWFQDEIKGWVLVSNDHDYLVRVANYYIQNKEYSIVNVDKES